jgi:hypothetical protein
MKNYIQLTRSDGSGLKSRRRRRKACARTLEDVGDLGGVGVAGEREAGGGQGELGGADGGDAEHGQVGRVPLEVGAALAAVRLDRLPRGQIHRHRSRLRELSGREEG